MKKIKLIIYAFALICCNLIEAQQGKQIKVIRSDFFDINQNEVPGAAVFVGNVQVEHEGVLMFCNKAYLFEKDNLIKAFGDFRLQQGDTLFVNSKNAEYNGNTQVAVAKGNVFMKDPKMTLATDSIHFNRKTQTAYYQSSARITNEDNVLTSKNGYYYADQKKLSFRSSVVITNPRYVVNTNYLDYFTNSGHAYLFGPSTIKSKENYIYTEKGFYNTKTNIAQFVKNSYIKYDNRLIKGDSLYYNRNKEFASATNNVSITDTINKFIAKGHYAEVYVPQDSLILTKRAQAISVLENDSLFVHAKKLIVTGKEGERVIRGFNNARFYKSEMSGKCDSIHSSQLTGITQLIKKPVIWNGNSQLTGDIMLMLANTKTEKLDSLKVLNNVFIVEQDTLGNGFNQVKGQNLFGKFIDNKISEVDIVKNTEMIYYIYDDNQELIGIEKNRSSKINLLFDNNEISSVTLFTNVDRETFPEDKFPENARKLRGFIWRGDERIINKEDIFPIDEQELHQEIINKTLIDRQKEDAPMEIRKETLEYKE